MKSRSNPVTELSESAVLYAEQIHAAMVARATFCMMQKAYSELTPAEIASGATVQIECARVEHRERAVIADVVVNGKHHSEMKIPLSWLWDARQVKHFCESNGTYYELGAVTDIRGAIDLPADTDDIEDELDDELEEIPPKKRPTVGGMDSRILLGDRRTMPEQLAIV